MSLVSKVCCDSLAKEIRDHLANVEKHIKTGGLLDWGKKKYSGGSTSSTSNLRFFWNWFKLKMIDTYILYLQNKLSNYYSEKMLDVDMMCPIVVQKTKTKIKAMWNHLSSYAALITP